MTMAEQCKQQIIQLLEENERGISEKTLQIAMSYVDVTIRAGVINDLLSQSKIELLKQGAQLIYKLKTDEKKICDTDEENVVYAIIEEAGNRGIWMREIRTKSKLPQMQLNKILKNMESKKMIKAVKSVAAYKKKVYMVYDIEPDNSVTGGTWYSNNDFESEFVEILNQQCFKYLQKKLEASMQSSSNPLERKKNSYARSSEICDYIRELGISKVELTTDDIETILETLVFDGKVEKNVITESQLGSGLMNVKTYRALNPMLTTTGLMRMPCGLCPVSEDCHEGGLISPSKCIYFKDWFDS